MIAYGIYHLSRVLGEDRCAGGLVQGRLTGVQALGGEFADFALYQLAERLLLFLELGHGILNLVYDVATVVIIVIVVILDALIETGLQL